MDATRRGKGGGWAPHVLEFMENTVLSTSWLQLGPLTPAQGQVSRNLTMRISGNRRNHSPEKKTAAPVFRF